MRRVLLTLGLPRRRAEETKDPEKRKRILDAINELDRLLPETTKAARSLVNNPR